MSTIQVRGLRALKGEIEIQGSKNAVLPMMAAAILHKGTTIITNVPRIQDVYCMVCILEHMGCKCSLVEHELAIDASTLTETSIPEEYVKGMRSSIMVLGALLGRMGEGTTQYPGGCSIGKRPINLHLYALEKLGAEITEYGEIITAKTKGLIGAEIRFSFPSVGATENALLASVLASGITKIHGAAKEPEIEELCYFLNHMGANIRGIGTSHLEISGVSKLHDITFRVNGDRIVAGTYMAAVTAATGQVLLKGICPEHLKQVVKCFMMMGAEMDLNSDSILIESFERPKPVRIRTDAYPAFPTDLQSQMLAVSSLTSGISWIEETIFEGRYETAKELQKMGANIEIDGKLAHVRGVYPLIGTAVVARDLRGGAALVVAGLGAMGETTISQCQHIFRGYEDICRDLSGVGAEIYPK